MKHRALSGRFFVMLLISALAVNISHAGKKSSRINIAKDQRTGEIVVSWSGKGVLKQADADGRFRPVHTRGNAYVVQPTEGQAIFQVDSPIVSVNVVGYVNLSLPPGLSLIANPLYYTNNTVAFWWPNAPDGAQVLKYLPEVGYEVSTFDALSGTWSNPEFEIGMGQGFFFRNTSAETIVQTFVGEVLQGTLVNPLPAGLSMEGSLVPQAGSINTVHNIPGTDGDEIRFWVNDGQGGGDYISSIFSEADGAWVPDLNLGVGQGFWIEKQQAQDWVRVFSVN
jgi:hypothetical protein